VARLLLEINPEEEISV